MEKKFRLYWKDKSTDDVKGTDICNAFTKAGYGAGAIRALDHYEEIKPEPKKNIHSTMGSQ